MKQKGFPKPRLFTPVNPQKYRGDPSKIVARSNLESRFFKIVDTHSSFKSWQSEEFWIGYISPVDNKPHRYFIDLMVETIDGTKYLVEIKPHSQTMPPKNKKSKYYLTEGMTYAVNAAKWDATKEFCRKNNFKFLIITEKNLPKVL